jgi:hypothetical protein
MVKQRKRTAGTYWEKLKDPRWQRKRLEVMEAAGFECESCGDKEATLNVHHKAYKKNADPWEYEIEELACLCEVCHAHEHALDAALSEALYKYKTESCGLGLTKERLLGYLQAAFWGDGQDNEWVEVISYEHAVGIADYCGYFASKEDKEHGIEAADTLCAIAVKKHGKNLISKRECDWIFRQSSQIDWLYSNMRRNPMYIHCLEKCNFHGWPNSVIRKIYKAASEFTG